MKIIFPIHVSEYPSRCKNCFMFTTTDYICHNERGKEGHCLLGYMSNSDMRDFEGNVRFYGCKIEEDERIILGNSEK